MATTAFYQTVDHLRPGIHVSGYGIVQSVRRVGPAETKVVFNHRTRIFPSDKMVIAIVVEE